jgi:hypothetical protein
MTQPTERAIHVGYEEFYIPVEGHRLDQAPIDRLNNVNHGCIPTTSGVEAWPHLETRSRNNVCEAVRRSCVA